MTENDNLKLNRFLLIVEDNPKGTTWCEIEYDEFSICMDNPKQYQIFIIDGKRAKICVAVWNYCANYSIALKTAISFVSGTCRKVTLNPEGFDPVSRNGEPLIHPPY